MRLTGATLLVIGFLLCVSIAWAAIGFFAMGFGLIFLLIAEERKKMSALHLESAAIQPAPIAPPQLVTAAVSSELRQGDTACESDKWRSLVESDQELSRVVRVLTPFGQKYVDQLAGAYIAFDNKAFLPPILGLVIASARQDAGLNAAGEIIPRNSIAMPIGLNSPDDPAADPFGEFASVTTTDGLSTGGREVDQSSQQRLASGEISEGRAAPEGIATEAVMPSQTPAHENDSDEFDNLRNLLEKIKDRRTDQNVN